MPTDVVEKLRTTPALDSGTIFFGNRQSYRSLSCDKPSHMYVSTVFDVRAFLIALERFAESVLVPIAAVPKPSRQLPRFVHGVGRQGPVFSAMDGSDVPRYQLYDADPAS